MEQKNKNHLHYEWGGYLLIVILAVIVWIASFNAVLEPSRRERLAVAVIGEGVLTSELEDALERVLPLRTSDKLREITVTQSDMDAAHLDQYLYSIADQADLILVTEGALEAEKIAFYFDAVTSEEALLEATVGAEYYTADGKLLGVCLTGGGKNCFSAYYERSEPCYVFFGMQSENIGGINGKGDPSDDAGLQAVSWMLAKE